MTAATITPSYMGGERLPLFPASSFEALAWHRMLDVLVRGLAWFRMPVRECRA